MNRKHLFAFSLLLATQSLADTITIKGENCREETNRKGVVIKCDDGMEIIVREHKTLSQRLDKWKRKLEDD